jgi:hypothetical protein
MGGEGRDGARLGGAGYVEAAKEKGKETIESKV